MITEEIVYKVLAAWRENPNIRASDIKLDKEDFFAALEIISDEGYVKNISFSRGGNKKIIIAFADKGTITMKGIRYLDEHNQKQPTAVDVEDDRKNVFLSYCWDDGKIADEIDEKLSQKGIVVKRDIRDIGDWHSIHEFMDSIRQQDYYVMIVSDKYLKSLNCMYEMLESIKEEKWKNKVIPVVIEKGIYNVTNRISYINFWENESAKLEAAMESISMTNRAEATNTLKKMKQISIGIGEFLETVADMNNPDIVDISEHIYTKIQNS